MFENVTFAVATRPRFLRPRLHDAGKIGKRHKISNGTKMSCFAVAFTRYRHKIATHTHLLLFIQVYPCAIPSDTLTNMAPKKSTKINFQWSDDEIELLLAVVNEYKTSKEANGLDWESIKTKYDDITTLFLSRYPKNQDADDQREFKHKNLSQEFSKERMVAKIKALRLKYRKALDTGRRSGGGRVVAQFYDICSHIWSGSPAAEAIQGGIDTSSTASANTRDFSQNEILSQAGVISFMQ